jgi:hypothetical protein
MLTCPVCEGWDQTQPVPAVVRSQTVVESTVRVGGGVGYGRNGIFPVITTDRTVMTGATQLARMLTLPVPRRPSGMCFFGWVLILLGAVPEVLTPSRLRSRRADPGYDAEGVVVGRILRT